jgi:uncharacterized protein (TIGR04255 family)
MSHQVKSSHSLDVLPSYKNPPVNEVVCGLRFNPPEKLFIPHIGFLWKKFRDDYPIVKHAPTIASAKGEMLVDSVTGVPIPRVWFINESDDQLVQFQSNRFYFNWRRRERDYPRYSHVIKNFESVRSNVISFFDEFEFGELRPIEYELSYINHIPQGQGWNAIDDLSKIFSDYVWGKSENRFLPNPEKVSWNKEFLLPQEKGSLTVILKQGVKIDDKIPLLILELRTRGLCESMQQEGFREWFDLAREWIVRGFTDLTTPEIQKLWEREDNA